MNKTWIVLFLLAFWACEPSSKNNAENEIIDDNVVTLEADFVKFYNTFHSDSLYQLQHIEFPLRKDPQDFKGEVWTAENWILHKPFDSSNGMFKRDFEVMNSLVFEEIIDANGYFNMVRRWAKLGDNSYRLIYYHAYNPSEEKSSLDQ